MINYIQLYNSVSLKVTNKVIAHAVLHYHAPVWAELKKPFFPQLRAGDL